MFKVLFVCHANLCRSPLAERLARHALDRSFGVAAGAVRVSSAGTHAYAGTPMHRESAAVLAELGIGADDFSARTVNGSLLGEADLVLTADRTQRAACVSLFPGAVRRAFTIKQFARLAGAVPAAGMATGDPADGMRNLVAHVTANRHRVSGASAAQDDLADPVGRPIDAFRRCAQEIEVSWATIVGLIAAT